MSAPSQPKKRRVIRIVLIQAAFVIVALVLAEIGFRIVLRARGKPFDAAATRGEMDHLLSTARDFVPRAGAQVVANKIDERAQARIVHPFYAWENVGGVEQLNAEMSRLDKPEFESDYEILVVGGSVADMFGHFGVPPLQKVLEADPRFAGKRFYFYRYGRGGFKQPQMLGLVNYLLGLGFTPDAVINIDGFNDVALSTDNVARGTSAIFPSIPHWGALVANGIADREALDFAAEGRMKQKEIIALATHALDRHYEWSAIVATLTRSRLNRLRSESAKAFDAYTKKTQSDTSDLILRGPIFQNGGVDDGPRRGARMWMESSKSLRGVCEAHGIYYLHVLQPTLHDTGSKTLTEEEVKTGGASDTWIRGVHDGYPLLRQAGKLLAAHGEVFYDATQVFHDVERTIYFDNCHFAGPGNNILGTKIGEEFLKHMPAQR